MHRKAWVPPVSATVMWITFIVITLLVLVLIAKAFNVSGNALLDPLEALVEWMKCRIEGKPICPLDF